MKSIKYTSIIRLIIDIIRYYSALPLDLAIVINNLY